MKRKIGNSWGVGGGVIHDPSGTEIPRGWGGSNQKNHPWEGYGYFLESCIRILFKLVASVNLILRPEQPYHKKHGLEKAEQQSAKDDGVNY